MKLLITGANGNLCQGLIPMLADAGHELVLLDIEPVQSDRHVTVQADVRDAGAVTAAMRGCDGVIHPAGYHDNMSRRRNDDDFFNVNVQGTHNVLLAMTRLNVRHLVYTSTVGVYGIFRNPDGRVRVIDEAVPFDPPSIYYATKVLCEEYCDFFATKRGLRIAKLRCSCFVPCSWTQAGMGLLEGYVARDDAAAAHVNAMDALMQDRFECEAFNIHADTPFAPDDWPALVDDPEVVVERYWPGSVAQLRQQNLSVGPIRFRYDIGKARRMLGYEPRQTFERFVAQLAPLAPGTAGN